MAKLHNNIFIRGLRGSLSDHFVIRHGEVRYQAGTMATGYTGCGAGIYCPDADVTRAQMAVFLVKTFNLP